MRYSLLIIFVFLFTQCQAQTSKYIYQDDTKSQPILPGAYSIDEYLPKIKDKRVAIVGNQTSEIQMVLLPDTLLSIGVNVVKIFSPEHGFRGNADAGSHIKNGVDEKTGIPIISLYGDNKKMKTSDLQNVDVVLYDLQDVGVRFYTYISTLEYVMIACASAGKELIILDRPNPLADVVDGPVLEEGFRSFVGMQRIPIIYGMTAGEYAQMLVGEKWIKAENLKMNVIPVKNYRRNSVYELPVPPSPNLKNMTAIYLYPSLCLFEGTVVSVGRGTANPFQMYGHPSFKTLPYSFTPQSQIGAQNPLLKGQKCYGRFLAETPEEAIQLTNKSFQLDWIIEAYKHYPKNEKNSFFNNFFNTLAGNSTLKKQIIDGVSIAEIRNSWSPELEKFKEIRKKYLIYSL